MGDLVVTTATADDADVILDILRTASVARAAHGRATWGSEFPDVIADLPGGLVHLATLGGRPAGAFVLCWADEAVWGPDDGDAGYLRRLATRPEVAGQGIGARLIATADDLIRQRGRHWLRLNCDRDNERLRAYYESLGFTYQGDITDLPRRSRPGRRDATRYQRAVTP